MFWLVDIHPSKGFLFWKKIGKVLSVQVFGCKQLGYTPGDIYVGLFWAQWIAAILKDPSDSVSDLAVNPENSIASLPAAMHPTKQDKGWRKTTLLFQQCETNIVLWHQTHDMFVSLMLFFQRVLRTEVGGKVAMQLPASVFGVGETSPVVTRRIDEESYNTLIFFHNSINICWPFRKWSEHNLRNFQDVLYIYIWYVFSFFLPWKLCPVFSSIHPAAVEFYKGKIR